jgi:histidinol-phosphate aminotransferase
LIAPEQLVRRTVVDLPAYKTGVSPNLLKALAAGASVARLGSNENPYGASPSVYDAIRNVHDVNLYPDGANTALCDALGALLAIDPERLLVSTGSENVLCDVFQSVLSPGERVVTLAPTFMLAEILTRAAGAIPVGVSYEDDLSFSVDAVSEQVSRGARILYLSNPNNPTGNAFTPDELGTIVRGTSSETLVVIDEAYYEYTARHEGYGCSLAVLEASQRPYVVLRTFSKAYGLAGLRVGYGIFYHPDLVPLVRRAATIFDVGSLSQAAALAAITDQAHVDRVVSDTLSEKTRVLEALAALEVRVFPALGNFVSLWFAERDQAWELEEALAARNVFVKALPGKLREGIVRVTVGKPEANDRFLAALASRS